MELNDSWSTVFSVGILYSFGTQFIHHGLGHLVIGTRPDINNLVVALALGDETRTVLILNLLNLCFRRNQYLFLVFRHDHVVNTDRDAGNRGETKPRVHQAVSEDDGLFSVRGCGNRR